jgi:hypothetical protein
MESSAASSGALRTRGLAEQKQRQLAVACSLLAATDEAIVRSVSIVYPAPANQDAAEQQARLISRVAANEADKRGLGVETTPGGRSFMVRVFHRFHRRRHLGR